MIYPQDFVAEIERQRPDHDINAQMTSYEFQTLLNKLVQSTIYYEFLHQFNVIWTQFVDSRWQSWCLDVEQIKRDFVSVTGVDYIFKKTMVSNLKPVHILSKSNITLSHEERHLTKKSQKNYTIKWNYPTTHHRTHLQTFITRQSKASTIRKTSKMSHWIICITTSRHYEILSWRKTRIM